MTDDLIVEVLPRPHMQDKDTVAAAKARIYERIRKLAHEAHDIAEEVRRWQYHPLARPEEMYLAMTLDSIEAMRRKPARCQFPGPEPKLEAAE